MHTAQLLLHPLPSDYASPPVQQNMFHNRISILCPAIAKFKKKIIYYLAHMANDKILFLVACVCNDVCL